LLASNNADKLAELGEILAGLPLTLVTPAQVGLDLEVDETGTTFEENARLKATSFAGASGLMALGDDSGLEIDALGGEPGVRSRRYAGADATDENRIALVLKKLEGVPPGRRTARFRCVMAVATPAGVVGVVHGRCEGVIAEAPRGSNGFGYDPIFLLPNQGRTMAELSSAEKHALSHRGRAGAAARELLQRHLGAAGAGSNDEPSPVHGAMANRFAAVE
jgi:XTP/dITP diphosphohydrolase